MAAADDAAGPVESLESIFRAHHQRVTRAIGRVIRDQARAEEIAVDVFLKWWRHPSAHGDGAEGWLYRTAIRSALDELRRQKRRQKMERLLSWVSRSPATPEEVHHAADERERVRSVLMAVGRDYAEVLLLRHQGLSYQDIASALQLTPSNIGSLLARAQERFRKEYERRYGQP